MDKTLKPLLEEEIKPLLEEEIKYVENLLTSVMTTFERKFFENNLKMLKKRLDTLR